MPLYCLFSPKLDEIATIIPYFECEEGIGFVFNLDCCSHSSVLCLKGHFRSWKEVKIEIVPTFIG
jgi:hypothetical protein